MPIAHVRQAIKEFLASPEPEVLCIRGHWGTGKTYNFQTIAREMRDLDGGVAMAQYAYVSLFGVNSLNEMKVQILQNTVVRSQIGDTTSFDSLKAFISSGEKAAKAGFMSLSKVFGGGSFDTAVGALSVFTSKQIICIDDLERKGASLRSKDVLGYISYLKEERKCKVVLLLNDEALKGEDKDQFSAYLEKVIDINLLFAPTPAESCAIAAPGTNPISIMVRERCTQLGIDNIRTIRKIHRSVEQIAPLLRDYAPDVFRDVASSLVLLGWMHHQPDIAPPLSFVLKVMGFYYVTDKLPVLTPQEIKWKELIEEYGFAHMPDFDRLLIKGIADGYFDQEIVDTHAAELHNRVHQRLATRDYQTAWQDYHYSFTSTEEEVVDTIHNAFVRNIRFMGADKLNNLMVFLRKYGQNDRAMALLALFIEENKDIDGAFVTDGAFIPGERIEPDLLEAFGAARLAQIPERTIDEVLLSLDRDAFKEETQIRLAGETVEEYYRAFRAHHHEQLRQILSGIRQYDRIANPNPRIAEIVIRAHEAMRRIARENRFNRDRIKGWGVDIVAEEEAAVARQAQAPLARDV